MPAIKDDLGIVFVAAKSNQQTAISIQPRTTNAAAKRKFEMVRRAREANIWPLSNYQRTPPLPACLTPFLCCS